MTAITRGKIQAGRSEAMRTGKVTPSMRAEAVSAAIRRRVAKVVLLPKSRGPFATRNGSGGAS